MSELAKKKCIPCVSNMPSLSGDELEKHLELLEEGWEIKDQKQLVKSYKFKNFKDALAYVQDIGNIAEEEGHHPDIELSWGLVRVVLWTHKIGGLSESDFILAAKCDVAYTSRVQ